MYKCNAETSNISGGFETVCRAVEKTGKCSKSEIPGPELDRKLNILLSVLAV
jgi:hypothetical protein